MAAAAAATAAATADCPTPSQARLDACQSNLATLADSDAQDEKRLEAAEQISNEFHFICDLGTNDPIGRQLLEKLIETSLNYLETSKPQFIGERPVQKLRKLLLDIIHRLHAHDITRNHVLKILKVMFGLFETDNEENVGTVLRIVIELHKSHKPEFIPEIYSFLDTVKNLYKNLRSSYDLNSMFEEKRLVLKDLEDATLEDLLEKIHTITAVELELPASGDTCSSQEATSKQTQTYTIYPKACRSIRTIAELPIIVVLMYQMYKTQLQSVLEQLLPLVLEATILRPPDHIRKKSDRLDKEIYVEFISAQIKCLSFVAYLVRHTGIIGQHHQQLTKSLLALLTDCPHEVVSIRRELMAAAKYIFGTELRHNFVEHLHVLCNEEVLVGSGWTVSETLRPQAYHTLVDLICNYKGRVKYIDLIAAINLFAKNLHDNTLPPHVQLISCKVFLSLIKFTVAPLSDENVEQRDITQARDLLMRIIEVFVLKFKNIATFHLAHIKKKLKLQQQAGQNRHMVGPENVSRDQELQVYSIIECKNALKQLILCVKTAIEAIPSYREQSAQILSQPGSRLFQPKETIILVRLLKYGLLALDVFTLAPAAMPMSAAGQMNRQMMAQATRGKEEKELLENFASVFTTLHPLIFQEVFTKMIDFVVERTRQNVALSAIVNFIISNSSVSPIFATILSEFLIVRMEEIGSNDDLSNLYLRMFKMVFASVTLYPVENEQMLKPLLHSIVNKSVELSLSAKEPYNYFLLLRALFRSIGGGSHDQLYTEFLPLLPNLLQGLNSFQSGQHKQHMKDLFTELCLTVPVRLSSLMPFMPTLIYPLVSALNGPHQLVSQGLRTLELCVDNIAPDYLYELLQPVRADLMQGLWKTVRHPSDLIAQACLRILGKFGGYNRRMLLEPQKLTYIEQKEGSSSHGTTIVVHFPDQKVSIDLPIDKAIQIACENLKQPSSSAHVQIHTFYKQHSWELIKGFLVASISNTGDHSQRIKDFFSNPNLATAHIPIRRENIYKCPDQVSRSVYQTALIGMMMAASTRELSQSVNPFLNAVVRHHVMLSVGQHLSTQISDQQPQGMDPFALVDALAIVIGHDDKDLCKSGYYVMVLMIETATMLLGSKERACELPLMSYLMSTMCELCYTRAWFSKMGGCISIRYFTDNMPLSLLLRYLRKFVKALLYVMSDLTGDISNGAVDMAQINLEHLLSVCCKSGSSTSSSQSSEEANLAQAQAKALEEVTALLIKEITSQNLSVRTHAMKSIELIARLSDKTPAQIMEPHLEILRSTLPVFKNDFATVSGDGLKNQPNQTPDKHQNPQINPPEKQTQGYSLERQPVRTQIGVIHGCTFCTSLEPKVFTIDTNKPQHKSYVEQLIRICESDDIVLKRFQCYANVTNLAPVRTAALQALASLHYVKDYENTIFRILFKTTESTCQELQEAAYSCVEKFTLNVTIDIPFIQEETAPLFLRLKDSKSWDMQSVKRVLCLAKLFPSIFDETFCNELQEHFKAISQSAVDDLRTPLNANEKVYQRTGMANEKIKICAGILEILTLIPPLTRPLSTIIGAVIKVETAAIMETGGPLREPLKNLLTRQPEQTISLLTTERNLIEQQVYRLLKYLLKGDSGKIFRSVICQQAYYAKLLVFTSGLVTVQQTDQNQQPRAMTFDLRYQAIMIISMMVKYDNDWLISRRPLVDNLRVIWTSEDFHNKHNNVETADYAHWKEPKLIVQCLLIYFQNQTAAGNKEVIELLFQLLRVFTNRYLCDFEFFRIFLEKTVIETYSIEWKREAFAKFVNVFHDPNYPQKLKAKILQHIIIPSFAHSFEKGLGEALLGGPPQPDEENPNNLIHMYVNKVIDPICSTDRRYAVPDALRILLLQFSCLLVDQASPHIHEATNRRQSTRLKKLVSLAWPCLQNRAAVDPAAKYYGHFLLAHIIAKFAVHKRIIIQVFISLLKASNPDARVVVKQALDVLLPAIPARLEDGNSALLKHTKKIIIDEGHNTNSLIHMLQLLVRHYRIYYPMRAELIPLMINAIHRLGFTANSGVALDNRRTAVDLCEVIMRWEMFRQKDVQLAQQQQAAQQQAAQQLQQAETLQQQQQQMVQQQQSAADVVQQQVSQEQQQQQPKTQEEPPTAQQQSTESSQQQEQSDHKPTPKPQSSSMDHEGETSQPAEKVEVEEKLKEPEVVEVKTEPQTKEVQPDQAPKTDQASLPDQAAHPDKVSQPDHADQSDKSAQPDHVAKPDQASQPNQASKSDQAAQSEHAAQPAEPQSQPQDTKPTEVPMEVDKSKQIDLEPLDPKHVDAILNALLRLACIVNPGQCDITPTLAYTTCKNLSERCITLIKKILVPDSWNGSPIVAPTGPNLTFSSWMNDLLCSVQNPNCNVGSISGALELLTYMCGTIRHDSMLTSLKHLTNGIIACTRSSNSRIIRSTSTLVQRVINIFGCGAPDAVLSKPFAITASAPGTPGTPMTPGTPGYAASSPGPIPQPSSAPHPDLEQLYSHIQRVIINGLNLYEQTQVRQPDAPQTNPREGQVPLFSSLMLLKAACVNNPTYLDKFMPTLIKVIQKMTKEHTSPLIETTPMSIELLIVGLDLVKNRLNSMTPDIRKVFIQQILSFLIENQTSDVKVLKAVVRIVEEWIKQKPQRESAQSQPGPNLREKTLLLIKLMLFIEKRFPTEPELNSQFLELIHYVYRDDELKTSDLTAKLESAFMSGLRCVQPAIRAKFFQIFDQSVKPKLYERLMYIVCAQNWQQIGCHFWIQQCIEFILAIALAEMPISTNDTIGCLSNIPTTADLGSYNPSDYNDETSSSLMSMLSNDANTVIPPPEDVEFVASHDNVDSLNNFLRKPKSLEESTARKNLQIMVNRQVNFLEDLKKTRTGDLLRSLTQLCHLSVDLAKETWITMFPRIWKVLNDQQMTLLGREIIPFLCSGAHAYQRDCNPSAIGAFVEAVSRCRPPIQMRPILVKYLGKNHNIWHRAALMLEEQIKDKSLDTVYPIPSRSNKANQQNQQDFDIITLNSKFTLAEEAVESVSDILELLNENDLWAGLWQRKAQYEETRNAVLCEQQGLFAQAQEYYEHAMDRQRREFDVTYTLKPGMKSENRVWEKHWIRCTKELNQWDSLLEYGSTKSCTNPMLVLESAWRVPNWQMMKEALILVEQNCPPSLNWRLNLYKGYNFICNQEKPTDLQFVDETVHVATSYCIQTWKKLPHIITNAHLNLLQATQQLLELNEAKSMHLALYGLRPNSIHDIRTIQKAWPKRLPILLDDLSYWSDILTWRQHQYQTIVAHFENQANAVAMGGHPGPVIVEGGPASVAMQGAHFSAQGIISFGTIARKQGLIDVCLDAINRIHTIPSVPIFDCFHKIRQQIKCYLQMPATPDKSELLDGLDIIECTNLKYFQKEFVSEFYTYKGIFLSRLNRHDDANKAFSCAAQLNDAAPKAWSAWGDYLEGRFTRDLIPTSDGASVNPANFANRQMDVGVSAVTCLLQACKFYPEPKARKYIAKVLWLLSFDNTQGEMLELINKYSSLSRDGHGIPPTNWIVWIPQILQWLVINPESDIMKNLLLLIGKSSPQAVYFPVRTLLHTLKIILANQPNQFHQAQASDSSNNSVVTVAPSTPTPTTSAAASATTGPATPTGIASSPSPLTAAPSTPRPSGPPTPGAPASTPVLIQQLQQPIKTIPSPVGSVKLPQSPLQGKQQHPQTPQGAQQQYAPSNRVRMATIQRCSEIIRRLYEMHPTTIASLDGITDQMAWLKDYSYEEIQRQFQQALKKCYAFAFENRDNLAEQTVNPQTLNFVRKLVHTFGIGSGKNPQSGCGFYAATVEYLSQRNQKVFQDPEFRQTRVKFSADFEDSLLPNMKLVALIAKLKNWINILAQKKKLMPTIYLMEDKCRFLSNFSQHTADVEIPGDALMPKLTPYYVRIARFIPEIKVVEKHNTSARRILIRGHNGKIYPYLVLNDSCLSDSRREERVLQLLRLLNQYLVNKKETGRRYLQFTAPRVVAINPGLRLVEDNPSSLSLVDILRRRINRNNRWSTTDMDQDTPIREYYEKLMKLQALGTPVTQKNLRDILTDVQNRMVPKSLLKDWASQTYVNATDYWVFRSQFTYQLAMACLCEYAFHLTRLMPESMYIHQDTGSINVSFFKFDLNDFNDDSRVHKMVPFRLTPNLVELITETGVNGPFRGALDAVSRCLTTPHSRVISIFRAVLRDEMLFWQKKGQDNFESHTLIMMVNRSVSKIYKRLDEIASNENLLEGKAPQLVGRATNVELLCQMDPAWHPWL